MQKLFRAQFYIIYQLFKQFSTISLIYISISKLVKVVKFKYIIDERGQREIQLLFYDQHQQFYCEQKLEHNEANESPDRGRIVGGDDSASRPIYNDFTYKLKPLLSELNTALALIIRLPFCWWTEFMRDFPAARDSRLTREIYTRMGRHCGCNPFLWCLSFVAIAYKWMSVPI